MDDYIHETIEDGLNNPGNTWIFSLIYIIIYAHEIHKSTSPGSNNELER